MLSFKEFLIQEGGAAGHMAHPFDIAKTGKELIDLFNQATQYIKKGSSSVKIDGVNASARLVDGKFVLDRGSAKPLDVKGIRPEDLESRFGPGHGFLEIGKDVLEILDDAYSATKKDLDKLGLTSNPNILLNIEYVKGQTNVIKYQNVNNFLAVHGIQEIKVKNTDPKTGAVKSRMTANVPFDRGTMDNYIYNLDKVAKKHGFAVLGNVGVSLDTAPNFNAVLSKQITLNDTKKTLKQWLDGVQIELPLITRKEYQAILSGDKKGLTDKQVNDFIIYTATIDLGDAILQVANSPIGELKDQEGVVVKDDAGDVYKITGSFILRGMESSFQK